MVDVVKKMHGIDLIKVNVVYRNNDSLIFYLNTFLWYIVCSKTWIQ